MARCSSNESDIRSTLSSIDNHKSSTQMNNLHAVAASELPSGRVSETKHVTEIFDILKEKHSCTHSLAVLIRMMKAANFKSTHITQLSAHLPKKRSVNSETQQADSGATDGEPQVEEHVRAPDFSFQKVLVDLANELWNGDSLRKLVNSLTDEERGTAADSINTAHELFRSMGHAESIVQGEWSSLNLLVRKLEAVGLKKQANTVRTEIQRHTSQQHWIERHIQGNGNPILNDVAEGLVGEDGIKRDRTGSFTFDEESHEINFSSSQNLFNGRNRNCGKRRTTFCTCCIVTAICLAVVVLAAIVIANYPLFVSDKSDSMNVYRNITYLAFGEGINTRFYDRVTFNLSSTAAQESISFSVQVCQIDCTNSNPKTLVNRLNYHETITTQSMRRIYARFSSRSDLHGTVTLLSEYMLSKSNISITVDYHSNDSTLDGAISLFLFDNVNNCENFYSMEEDQGENAIQNYTFGNGDVSIITVQKDGFYCAVWDISVAANFSYTIESDILLYDIKHYLNQDATLCSEPHQSLHEDNPFDVAVTRNPFKDFTKCFLVFQSHSDDFNVTVESTAVAAHTNNSFFIVSIPVIIFLLLLCNCTIIPMICYVRKCFCFRQCSV